VAYFMAVVTDTNMAWTLVPRRATAPIMANTTPDATTQYSIEVAPDSSLRKAVSSRRIDTTFSRRPPTKQNVWPEGSMADRFSRPAITARASLTRY
jgi:hypothetical protein